MRGSSKLNSKSLRSQRAGALFLLKYDNGYDNPGRKLLTAVDNYLDKRARNEFNSIAA